MTDKPLPQRLRETVFAVAGELGLSRSERLQVAAYVLHREVSSFTTLDPDELVRVVDGFRGAQYFKSLQKETS